ncbi:DUF6712 family protein [Sphingobacterium anhuiense]|uniref:DUF6712 family protein n=1 Tax=Sphingobacterium anhuiense TaxID=493780 RepID=UPI003C30EAE8
MRLFSDISEIKQKVSINGTFNLGKIRPHISRTERSHIAPLLGDAFYNQIAEAYQAALVALATLPEPERKKIIESGQQYTLMPAHYWPLMEMLQDAIANIAFMSSLSQTQLNIGDAGVSLSVNENTKTAFQWQIDDLKYQFALDGFNALNELLVYLENSLSEFPTWASSDAYFEQKKYFVESAEVFSDSYQINSNRMSFLTLRYIMKRIELHDVATLISSPLFERLKEKQKTGYSSSEKVLMERFIIPGIVLLTVAKGIVERAIEVTDIGVQINLYTYYATLKDARKKGGDKEREAMIEQLTADGNEFLRAGKDYIDANQDQFSDYVDTESEMSYRVINKKERKIFGM